MDSKKALSIFGEEGISKRSSSQGSENSRASTSRESLNYKNLNETLLRKIAQLKGQLRQSEKSIERLCEENEKLRQTNRELASATDEEKIEILVEQRVKSRLAHVAAISHRTIQYLQNAGNDMKEALKDFEIGENNGDRPKRARTKLGVKPALENLTESPISASTSQNNTAEDVICIESDDQNEAKDNQEKQMAEPTITRKSKGRRSGLIEEKENETPHVGGSRRGPFCITPKTNRRNSGKRKENKSEKFAKPETPVRNVVSTPANLTASVRAKRSATLKVKTYAEMPDNFKLRRPDKFDEPLPFVNRFTY